jgi:RNA polymerase sigma-70 factor (ECF subfamily)
MTTETSDQLDTLDMARLADGHDAALNDLMARHAERLFHYLIRQTQNENDAADLAQESFTRVYINRAKFDRGARFSTWLYTIATNLVRDRFRHLARHPQVSLDAENEHSGEALQDKLPDVNPGPGEVLQKQERADAVRGAVARLPEDLRTALILTEYEERSNAEAAEILGCSVKALESRLHRARRQLRSRLENLPEFSDLRSHPAPGAA